MRLTSNKCVFLMIAKIIAWLDLEMLAMLCIIIVSPMRINDDFRLKHFPRYSAKKASGNRETGLQLIVKNSPLSPFFYAQDSSYLCLFNRNKQYSSLKIYCCCPMKLLEESKNSL